MARTKTLFWDVDTQYDFMIPKGKLYVEGAFEIVPIVSSLRKVALETGCSILSSMDWHRGGNPEISDEPDYKSTFPPHCMADSPGAQRVGFLGDLPIESIDPEPRSPAELAELVHRDQFHIAVHKETLDVFSNPNTVTLLESMSTRPERIVVFGVALDLCVKRTLDGLGRMPDIQLVLVRDATRAVDTEAGERVIEDFERRGGQVAPSHQVQEMAQCG